MEQRFLVTGAAGFLGRQLVRELALAHPDREIVAMARNESSLSAWLTHQRVPLRRITVVDGDVTDAVDCGLPAQLVERLRQGSVDVFHCAARYRLSDDDATANARVNATGTANMLALAGRVGARSVHHASTFVVSGDYAGVWTEEHLGQAGDWSSAYARTKHRAEVMVRASSIPVRAVYRLGVLIGDAATGTNLKDDGLYSFLPALQLLARAGGRLPVPTAGTGQIPLCPVDHAARAIVALASSPEPGCRTYHVFEDEVLRADEIIGLLADAAGMRRRAELSWLTSLLGRRSTRGASRQDLLALGVELLDLLGQLGVPTELLGELRSRTRYSNATTSQRLARLGVASTRFAEYAPRIWFGWQAYRSMTEQRERQEQFRGRTFVITGATSGIGARLTRKMLARGAEIIALGRDERKLQSVLAHRGAGAAVTFIHCDLMDDASVDAAIERLREVGPIDGYIHSAGVSIDRPIARMSPELNELQRMTQVNFLAPMRIVRALLDQLKARPDARVVALSSISTQVDIPGFAGYSASKAALDQAFSALAAECANDRPKFVSVRLPLVKSPMTRVNSRLRNVPMMSEQSAAELVLESIEYATPRTGVALGAVFELVRLFDPRLARGAALLGWRGYMRMPSLLKSLREAIDVR